MQRTKMVHAGANQLIIAENALENALCEVAALGLQLGRMRMDSGLSAVVGQEAIEGVAALYSRLSKARRDAVQLHALLNQVKMQIGCGAVATGADGGKPGTNPTGQVHVVPSTERAA